MTLSEPAQPGEVIHVYGSGFGPVSPTPATGEAARADPPSVLVVTPECQLGLNQTALPVEVLFAGLAPDMVGVYQIDLRMPTALSTGSFALNCKVEQSGTFGFLPLTSGSR